MPYQVVVGGVLVGDQPTGAVRTMVAELVAAPAMSSDSGALVVRLPDQAAMVALLCRLHDIGVKIDSVVRCDLDGARDFTRSG